MHKQGRSAESAEPAFLISFAGRHLLFGSVVYFYGSAASIDLFKVELSKGEHGLFVPGNPPKEIRHDMNIGITGVV
jgi:hypothetical protein